MKFKILMVDNAVYLFTEKSLLSERFSCHSFREHYIIRLIYSNFTGRYKQSQLNAQVSLNYFISQYVAL